ncbi:MAG: hypothetical protein FJ398_16175 [Verrucomicrobia bacterium]|nr:hypothetical protein [Verrucomicrobiota bacterium]
MPPISPILLAAVSAPPAADSQSNWVALILREFGRSQATGFIFDMVKWTLLGAAIGIAVAAVACAVFWRLQWYEISWRFARALRWTLFALATVISGALFGLAGFWSGAIAGSERVLSRSQLATDVFPKIGDAIADAMAWVQVRPQFSTMTNDVELSSKLAEFRAGKWELHAEEFLQQIASIKGEVTNLVAKVEQSTLRLAPQLKGGLGEKLLHQFLKGLGRLVVEKKAASELKGWGADRIYYAILQELKTAAANAGHPDTIARSEISSLLVEKGIVPAIMKPIRATARAQQLPLIALALMAIVLPPLCVRLARRWSARKSIQDLSSGKQPFAQP